MTKDKEQQINTSTQTGFAIGVDLYLSLAQNIGVQCEPVYIQKGAKVKVKWVDN
jgi:hypothetical protein